jgi:ferredoxin
MVNPSFTPEQLQAEISAIGREVDGFGVVLHCARAAAPVAPPDWYNIALPCVGMVLPHWVLAPLFLGAAAVTVSACGCGKEADADERSRSAVAFARLWLSLSGIAPDELVVDQPSDTLPTPVDLRAEASLFGVGGAAAMAQLLAAEPVRGDASPLGVVAIDDATCTGCEMCATVCPSDALRSVPHDGLLRIEFEPASCTACGQCLDRCPEPGALALEGIVDVAELDLGRRTVVTHQLARCVKCGETVAPEAALARVTAALGDQPTILKQITSVCLDCRGTTMVF